MSDKRITDLELLTELSGEYYLVVDDGTKARKYNITPIINDNNKLASIEAGAQVNRSWYAVCSDYPDEVYDSSTFNGYKFTATTTDHSFTSFRNGDRFAILFEHGIPSDHNSYISVDGTGYKLFQELPNASMPGDKLSPYYVKPGTIATFVYIDGVYVRENGTAYYHATQGSDGLMSAADKTKLDAIEAGSEVNVIETITLNGVTLTPDSSKVVNIPAATANDFGVIKVQKQEQPGIKSVTLTYGNNNSAEVPILEDGKINYMKLPDATTSTKGAVVLDTNLSETSTNPLQNKAVTAQVDALTNDITTNAQNIDDINSSLLNYVNRGYVEDGIAYFMHDDEELFQITGIGGGGGGGGGNNAILTLTNASGWLSKILSVGSNCSISVSWSSLEQEQPTGNGVLTIRVNNVIKATMDVTQGLVSANVTNYLGVGTNKVRVTIADVYGNTSSIIFSVQIVNLEITSAFDSSGVFTANSPIGYTYTPIGNAEKTVHFVVDGTDVAQAIVTTSGRQQTQALSGMSHGSHTLLVYFTATIEGTEVRSNELYYDLTIVDSSSTVPIITSPYRETEATQYQTISIPYKVYTPNSLTSEVKLYVNNELINTLTVDRLEQTWNYRPDTTGTLNLKLKSGTIEKSFTITVSDSGIDIDAETNDLVLYLTANGRSNSEQNPGTWTYDTISAIMTNFNFVSDGWINDSEGYTALRVSGDARVIIPYQIFAQDFRSTGKTIEIEFATRNILNYDSVIMSCMSDDRGFQLTAQKALLKSEQSEIFTQYKEDEHVRVAFVVEKRAENRLIYIYTNGIMSGVVQYPDDDDFSQISPVGISIGSNYCTTDIYCIRVYDNNLTRFQILENWIADTQDIDDLLARYNHNDVYDEYGQIVIEKLPNDLPYLIVTASELPQYKGDKKTVSGTYIDPTDSSKSFTFSGAQMDVQGTSSQYYARKNYKVKFKNGFDMTQSGQNESGFAMREDSIATNTFTFKADVASSEGANNVELVRLYNNACPYETPAQELNENVRQGIDGFPIVMFWNDGTNVTFLGKYNFNNDKGTPEVFGFDSGDESWEVLNNTSNRVLWKSADYSGTDWQNDFESRYPEDYFNVTNLSTFASWIVTTDTTAATGNALSSSVTYDGVTYTTDSADYRLAKFKAELGNYVEVESALFYYLFTELFLMVDSRAKNMFPSFIGSEV